MVEGLRVHNSSNQSGDEKGTWTSDSHFQTPPKTERHTSSSRKRYLRMIAPLCIALGRISTSDQAEVQAQETPCTLTDRTTLSVNATSNNMTCIQVITLPDGKKMSIVKIHGDTRAENQALIVESDTRGYVYNRQYTELKHPDYKLPATLTYTSDREIDVTCVKDQKMDVYSCSSGAPAQKEINKPLEGDECLSTWGTRITKGVEQQDGYTCTWKGQQYGIEYANFAHDSHPTFVVFNPKNGYFTWDYGQIDPQTFITKPGPVPLDTSLRISAQPSSKKETMSILDRLKLFVASILSTDEQPVSPEDLYERKVDSVVLEPGVLGSGRCIQNPINNMSLTQKYGHTEFARNTPEIYGPSGFHNGIDLNSDGGSYGQPVRHALCFGTVTRVEDEPNQCGSCSVRVATEIDGVQYTFLYFHLACPTAVNPGQVVESRTILGTIGPDDSCSTGPHLHLGLYNALDQHLDPLSILPFASAQGSGHSPQ